MVGLRGKVYEIGWFGGYPLFQETTMKKLKMWRNFVFFEYVLSCLWVFGGGTHWILNFFDTFKQVGNDAYQKIKIVLIPQDTYIYLYRSLYYIPAIPSFRSGVGTFMASFWVSRLVFEQNPVAACLDRAWSILKVWNFNRCAIQEPMSWCKAFPASCVLKLKFRTLELTNCLVHVWSVIHLVLNQGYWRIPFCAVLKEWICRVHDGSCPLPSVVAQTRFFQPFPSQCSGQTCAKGTRFCARGWDDGGT